MQWLAYVLVKGFLILVRLIPLPLLAALGRCGGRLSFWLDRRHRRVALRNLQIAFPDKSDRERRAIAWENFGRVGQNFTLFIKIAQLPRERIPELLEVTGVEHFRAAREKGKGVIALLGHFGNWELLSRVNNVVKEVKILDVYSPLKFEAVSRLLQEMRSSSDMHFVERGDAAAAAVAWLRQNETVSLIADQRAGAGRGMWFPMFGRLAAFDIGPAVLARRTGAAIVPISCEPCGRLRWRLQVLPAIPTEKRGIEEVMTDIVRLQEDLIRRDPPNWLWAHNRWKTARQFLDVKLPKKVDVTTAITQPLRVLIRSVNWLGDAVMTFPAVQQIKQSRPDLRLSVLTEPKLADLWRAHPDVDEVIVQERSNNPFTLWRYAAGLRARRFEAAVIFPNSWRSVLPLWLAGIPRRIGFRGHQRARLLTDGLKESVDYQTRPAMDAAAIQRVGRGESVAVERPAYKHQIHRHLWLVKYLGGDGTPCEPRLKVDPAAPGAPQLPQDRPLVAINVGAEYGPAKRWPLDRFIAVAKALSDQEKVRWVVIGGPKEAELGQQILSAVGEANVINMAGKTTLGGLCQLLAQCRLLLTNDSGPMHLADALGKPVVGIFGSTEPALTAPGLASESRHAILRHAPACSPCFLRQCPIDFRCMTALSVAEVAAAVRGKLSAPAGGSETV